MPPGRIDSIQSERLLQHLQRAHEDEITQLLLLAFNAGANYHQIPAEVPFVFSFIEEQSQMAWRAIVGAIAVSVAGFSATCVSAEDPILNSLYGDGVHAYFDGSFDTAYERLTEAIDQGSEDPRCFYFRGLALAALGRPDESAEDYVMGAKMEALGSTEFIDVSRSLQRVQGFTRLEIEGYRESARVEAHKRAEAQKEARYEQLKRSEENVLRDMVRRSPQFPPVAVKEDFTAPFGGNGETVPEAKDGDVMPLLPETDDTAGTETPFGGTPAAAGDDDPFGGPGDDPFGGSSQPAADDPFGGSTTPASGDDPFGGSTPAGDDPFGGSTTPAAETPNAASDDPFGGSAPAGGAPASTTETADPFGGSSATPGASDDPFGGSAPAGDAPASSTEPADPFGSAPIPPPPAPVTGPGSDSTSAPTRSDNGATNAFNGILRAFDRVTGAKAVRDGVQQAGVPAAVGGGGAAPAATPPAAPPQGGAAPGSDPFGGGADPFGGSPPASDGADPFGS